MQKTLLTLLTLMLFTLAYGQKSGKITYTEKVVFDIKLGSSDEEGEEQSEADKKMQEKFAAMMPKDQSFEKELLFTETASLYQDKKGAEHENVEMESDDGSIKIMILSDEVDNILYCDFDRDKMVHQTGIMGKPFTIEDKLQPIKWKLTGERIKYLGYECMKAVYEDTDKDEFIVAWYSSELPVRAGPSKYHSLPGAVLMVNENDGKKEIRATKVELVEADQLAIKQPKKGKKVSQEEFDKIEEQKTKEMMENSKSMRREFKTRN